MKNKIPPAPEGYHTIMPFVMTNEAEKVKEFVINVFDAIENKQGLTYDTDGLILHSEVTIGNSIVAIVDRKPDWLFTPSFLQIYVSDVEATLKKAEIHGGKIITKPTIFYDSKFSRMQDPWGNIWWVYEYISDFNWEEVSNNSEDNSQWEPTEEAKYIHSTLLEAMKELKKKSI